jgi:hypothetical protein
MNTSISSFEDLIAVARRQPEPQRLLFVFTRVELPEDCTAEQRSRFEAGVGGALTPLACLDKTPEELGAFRELLDESRQFVQDWTIVFVAALSGKSGRAPSSEDAEAPLNKMVESIKAGTVGMFVSFDVNGDPVVLSAS